MKMLLFVVCLCGLSFAQAQVKMSSLDTHHWNLLRQQAHNSVSMSSELEALPIYSIHGRSYVSVIGKTHSQSNWQTLLDLGVMQGAQVGTIATAKIPVDVIDLVDLSTVFTQLEIPSKVAPHLDRVRYDVGADDVYFGTGLPEGFDGENVLIGITDWGFDYTHPMFYDTLLQQSRVVAAWDQFKNSGPHPVNYNYGTVYDSVEELMAAGSDTANIYSFHTHGNHVAGIAGGGGAGIQYRGMAPAAGFLFTTFLIDAGAVIDGFRWMQEVAQQQGKRLVINMSWGLTYMGTLDGTSMLSEVINQMSEEGVVFVSSAGNNGDNDHHIKRTFNNSEMNTRINFDTFTPQPNNWGQSITMWGEPNATFWSRLQVYNSLNVLQATTPQYYTDNMPLYLDSMLIVGADTVYFNVATDASFMSNQRPHMRLRVRNTNSALRIVLNSGAAQGTVHYWNVVELMNGVGNWGMPFTSFGTGGVNGDSEYSIAEPTCAASCISVAAYAARYLNNFGNLTGGGIASFTSYGPLINEVMKPDIAAPGVNVTSSISSFTDYSYSVADYVFFQDIQYDFARMSGTSMSSPCVAGIVALMLDANPFLTPAQVKEIIKITARTDSYTDAIAAPGDVRWGMGKIDARAAVSMSLATEGLNTQEMRTSDVRVYPNPATDAITVRVPSGSSIRSLELLGMNGQRCTTQFSGGRIDVSALAPGLYILQLDVDGRLSQTRITIVR
ncbi:MAG: S8 family peptidase [Flavobacteriales bacterium]|jgi:minor extracellular serine protease Vpr